MFYVALRWMENATDESHGHVAVILNRAYYDAWIDNWVYNVTPDTSQYGTNEPDDCAAACRECEYNIAGCHAVGAMGVFHTTKAEFRKFTLFFINATDNYSRFGLAYTYDIADHAAAFYRNRRAKYKQIIVDSTLADLAVTIIEYV
jgi:hypothetical protein